ncbi:hypothetical protein [Actomonas aquatica]|uniref:Uncharacterized protein n=1 Tax=Actomonas aquatica TaxID=2866162 RepID=A0ABZ1C3G4_9BACT|nr:hypothetical protein [Opitutus sp. WL0086]WRQ86140.1 hypothetical protein K1X11_015095 [Opitutus sp. WL0086]
MPDYLLWRYLNRCLQRAALRSLRHCQNGGGAFGCWAMVKGQRVVCINDTFSDMIRALYKQLPTKGETYTIREVFLGREKVVKGGDSATVGLLLEEIHNPPDPFHAEQQELGFTSERFAPLEELPPEEASAYAEGEAEFELVGPGNGAGGSPDKGPLKWDLN